MISFIVEALSLLAYPSILNAKCATNLLIF